MGEELDRECAGIAVDSRPSGQSSLGRPAQTSLRSTSALSDIPLSRAAYAWPYESPLEALRAQLSAQLLQSLDYATFGKALSVPSCLVLHAVVRAPRHLTGAGEVGLAPQFHGLETSSRSSSRRETTGASHTVVTKRIVGWSLVAIAKAAAPQSRPPAGWMHGQLRPMCPCGRSG